VPQIWWQLHTKARFPASPSAKASEGAVSEYGVVVSEHVSYLLQS